MSMQDFQCKDTTYSLQTHVCICVCTCAFNKHESLPTAPSGWAGRVLTEYVLDLWGHCKNNESCLSEYHRSSKADVFAQSLTAWQMPLCHLYVYVWVHRYMWGSSGSSSMLLNWCGSATTGSMLVVGNLENAEWMMNTKFACHLNENKVIEVKM